MNAQSWLQFVIKLSAKPLYKPVQVLMDSGADLSVISETLLPTDHKQCWPVIVKAVGNQAKLYQTALIPAEIDGYALQPVLYCCP